jgi:CheY-like chemotaxis protein
MRSILFAEDNTHDAELITESLSGTPFADRLVLVQDGVEAMQYLRSEGRYAGRSRGMPAVVVLDIKMPRMDGIEVLRAIRLDHSLYHIPVVMLTSSREERDLIRSYGLGSNAYVVKPFAFADFVSAIRQITSFWGLLNELPPEGAMKYGN